MRWKITKSTMYKSFISTKCRVSREEYFTDSKYLMQSKNTRKIRNNNTERRNVPKQNIFQILKYNTQIIIKSPYKKEPPNTTHHRSKTKPKYSIDLTTPPTFSHPFHVRGFLLCSAERNQPYIVLEERNGPSKTLKLFT